MTSKGRSCDIRQDHVTSKGRSCDSRKALRQSGRGKEVGSPVPLMLASH